MCIYAQCVCQLVTKSTSSFASNIYVNKRAISYPKVHFNMHPNCRKMLDDLTILTMKCTASGESLKVQFPLGDWVQRKILKFCFKLYNVVFKQQNGKKTHIFLDVDKRNHSGCVSVSDNASEFHCQTKTNQDLVSVCYSFDIWKIAKNMKITNKLNGELQLEQYLFVFVFLLIAF